MELKHHVTLQTQKGDFVFYFNMPHNSTWGHALEAMQEISQAVNQLAEQAVKQHEEQQQNQPQEAEIVEGN